jgi:hypothetical protein
VARPANRKPKLFQKSVDGNPEENIMSNKVQMAKALEAITKAALSEPAASALKKAFTEVAKVMEELSPETFAKLTAAISEALQGGGSSSTAAPEMPPEGQAAIEQAKTAEVAIKKALDAIDVATGIPQVQVAIEALAPIVKHTPIRKALDALPPEAKAQLEAIQKSLDGEKAAREKLEKSLADERAGNRERVLVQKAEREFGHVAGITPVALGTLLRKAEDAGFLAELEPVLKTAEAVAAKSQLFGEFGSNRAGGSTSAEGKLSEMAKARVTKGEGKQTYEQAYTQVLHENPELYAQYEAERSARR